MSGLKWFIYESVQVNMQRMMFYGKEFAFLLGM